jgi:hypothetical protein
MPTKRTYKKKSGKYTYYKKYSRFKKYRKNYNFMKIGRNIVAKSTMVKLRYSTVISLNPGLGAASIYQFKANGMYDPDFTGSGHQPMGFDQWMTFYDHFTVVGSKITITAINNQPETYTLACSLVDDTAIINPTSFSGFLERNGTVWKHIAPVSGSANKGTISKKFSAKKFFGTKDFIGKSEFKGTSAGDPSELAMFNIILYAFDRQTDVPGLTMNIVVEYITVFTEPIQQLPQS